MRTFHRVLGRLAPALCVAVLSTGWSAASAHAGAYTWALPNNFTLSGANPDHGDYGDTPGRYLDGPSASQLTSLDSFEGNVQGGLAGWTDSSDAGVLVGTDPQAQQISGGPRNEDTFGPGQMVLEPTMSHVAAIGWTAPIQAHARLEVTLISDETGSTAGTACGTAGWDAWSIDVDGRPLAGQSGIVPANGQNPETVSAAVSLSAGQELELVVAAGNGAAADPGCAPVGASIQIQLPSSTPTPALGQPASGAVIANGEPVFSGTATDGFGAGSTVTVRVYRGAAIAPGSLVDALIASRSGSGFSVAPDPMLYNGTYTVQVEQDDLAGDAGFSEPLTFRIADPLPHITLARLGTRPLRTHTPVLRGAAGTLADESGQVEVLVWSGTDPSGYPVRHLSAVRDARGRWRVRVAPRLPDGVYVAVAAQNSPAGLIGSQPVRFRIASAQNGDRQRRRKKPPRPRHKIASYEVLGVEPKKAGVA